jgi:hypothetical protein
MVTVEVGEEQAVHPGRVDTGAPHAAHRAESEVEDESLLPRLDHDATLPSSETQRGGARADNRDVHFGKPASSSLIALRYGGASVVALRGTGEATPFEDVVYLIYLRGPEYRPSG